MDAPSLTRRHALALGAAAGLSPLIARVAPALARPGAAPTSFGMDVRLAGGRTGVVRPRSRFDLVGVRGPGLARAGLEVRVRQTGRPWSPWVPLGPGHDHRPDTGTGAAASDPVWAGGADELQLRATGRPPLARLRLHLVVVGPSARALTARAAARARIAQAGAPPMIPREAWGAATVAPRTAPSYGDVQVAFVHHTVSANDYGPADSAGIVLAMAKYHRDVNGWNDLGYNFVVDRFGQIFEGRAGGVDQPVVGAQAQGYNSHSTGIANIGTFSDVPQTPEALDAMARLIAWKLPLHGVPVTGQVTLVSGGGDLNRYPEGTPVVLERICGHRDGDATACPGDALYAQLPELRARAAAIAPFVVPVAVALAMQPPVQDAVAYGQPLVLAGTLRGADGAGLAGQRVVVQKRGRAAWSTVATAMTDGAGAWQASLTWRRAGAVRARAAVPGAPVAVTSPLTVGLLDTVSVRAAGPRVRAGSRVLLYGKVAPLAHVRLDLERQGGDGRWRRAGSVTVKPQRSAFSVRVRLSTPGLYRITPRTPVRSPKASGAAAYVRAVRPGRLPRVGGTAA